LFAGEVASNLFAMGVAQDDWRRRGQEHLRDVRLTWKRYQALSAQWEHEHCALCWHKFLDPNYAETHRQALQDEPDKHSAGGYTNLGDEEGQIPGKWWICGRCFEDFAAEFGWVVVETDADAWPYAGPEPQPRPTGADYTPPQNRWLPRPQ
jgi:hypothetical protein